MGLLGKASDLIARYGLDHGRAEVFQVSGPHWSDVLFVTVEAPNHSTICTSFPKGSTETDLRRGLCDLMREFDADEEFDVLWSREFGAQNGYRPSEFMGMLQEDMAFFLATAARMDGTRERRDTILSEVRWTDADLRYLLMRHHLPVTDPNLDAMHRMVDGQALRNRSIRHGWEVIESMVDWDALDPEPSRADDDRNRAREARGDRDDGAGLLTDPADPVGLSLGATGPGEARGM